MSDTSTLRIPADMALPIEVTDIRIVHPATYVTGVGANPDEFCVAIYPDHAGDDLTPNHRATVIAQAATLDGSEVPHINGDAYLVLPEELAQRILDNDEEHIAHRLIITAFRTWLFDFAENNALDPAGVFEEIMDYGKHVHATARDNAIQDHVKFVADAMGIDPSQVGVVLI